MLFAITLALAAALLAPTSDASAHANSSVMQTELGPCCQFLPNIDLPSANIGTVASVPAIDKGDCCTYCSKLPNCLASVWTDYNGGTCWHKSTYSGGASVKIGALTILTSCTPTWVRLNNCDMPGNDITSAQRSRPEDCFAICKVTEVCAAFTWSDYNGGTCWLKSAVAPCTSAGNKHSGAMGRGGYW